jgi:pentatricopeptide repeat protein
MNPINFFETGVPAGGLVSVIGLRYSTIAGLLRGGNLVGFPRASMRQSLFPFPRLSITCLLILGLLGCGPAGKIASHLAKADAFYDAGDFEKAEIEYLNVLQLNQQNPQATVRLGLIYFDQGQLSRVLPLLIKGRELQPDNMEVRIKLGMMYLLTGRSKEARDEANLILDRHPGEAEAMYLLVDTVTQARELEEIRSRLMRLPAPAAGGAPVTVALGLLDLRQRKYKEAKAAFSQALALEPKSSAANAAMGALALQENDLPRAEQCLAAAAENSPGRSIRRIQYAQFKLQHGDIAGGRKLLDDLLGKYPDYVPAQLARAEVAVLDKNYSEGAAIVANVLARNPGQPEALILSARLKVLVNEPAKAVTELESAVALYPKSPQIHYQLGATYLATGQTDKALASLNQAVLLAPGYAEALLLQASVNVRKGDLSAAILALKQLIPYHPEIVQGWLMLADAYSRQGNFNDALNLYDQMEKVFPGSAQTPLLRGLTFVQQRKFAEARRAFNRALEISPGAPAAMEQLVALDVLEKQYPAALQRVNAMIARDPKGAGPHLLQARICYAQKDLAGAEAALKTAIELQPDLAEPYFMLAGIYANGDQPQKALENLEKLSAKDPRDVQALMLIGLLQEQRKNYSAARTSYEQLLAINPKSGVALNNLACLYAEQFQDLNKAQELAQKARDLLPQEPHTADTLGWILYKNRQYARALSLLQESAGKLPASADVQLHLGLTRYMLGQEEGARSALQAALELDPNLTGKDEANSKLAILAADPDKPDTRAVLEAALAKRPDDPVVLVRLAAALDRAGDANAAIKTYQTALQANPASIKAVLGLSQLYLSKKDNQKALEMAKTARKLAPTDPVVAQTLGQLAYEVGEFQWAASLLQEAAQRKSDSPDLYFDLARSYYSVGRTEDAANSLRDALKLTAGATGRPPGAVASSFPIFTHAADARRWLDLIVLAGSPDEALKKTAWVEGILAEDPANPPALMLSGMIMERQLDASGARQAYAKVLRQYPDFSPAKLRLAIMGAALRDGFDQKTFDWALQARAAYPSDRELAKSLGILTYRKGDHARAAVLLKESLGSRENDAETWFYLGMTQAKLNRPAESKVSLKRAMELKLPADLATEAGQLLSSLP